MIIVKIEPSFYFSGLAEVLITNCGHRHLRPIGKYSVGDNLNCPYCDEQKYSIS